MRRDLRIQPGDCVRDQGEFLGLASVTLRPKDSLEEISASMKICRDENGDVHLLVPIEYVNDFPDDFYGVLEHLTYFTADHRSRSGTAPWSCEGDRQDNAECYWEFDEDEGWKMFNMLRVR